MPTPIDISLTVSPELPRWPGSPAITFDRRLALSRGDPATDTTISFSVHTGTHIDAPSHVIARRATVEAVPLDVLIGRAQVIALPDCRAVDSADLAGAGIPAATTRLLIRTANSDHWQAGETGAFREDYVALTAEAAGWVVEHGIRLIGVDYLSVQRFRDPPDTHHVLLDSGVVIVEGLNLSTVEAGAYSLCCLPLKLAGLEGAPARAVLLPTCQ